MHRLVGRVEMNTIILELSSGRIPRHDTLERRPGTKVSMTGLWFFGNADRAMVTPKEYAKLLGCCKGKKGHGKGLQHLDHTYKHQTCRAKKRVAWVDPFRYLKLFAFQNSCRCEDAQGPAEPHVMSFHHQLEMPSSYTSKEKNPSLQGRDQKEAGTSQAFFPGVSFKVANHWPGPCKSIPSAGPDDKGLLAMNDPDT